MPVMTQDEKASYATNVGVYTNTFTGVLTPNVWTTITWDATPLPESNNNPTSQSTTSRFNVSEGLWRLRLRSLLEDNGTGNPDSRFNTRFLDSLDAILPNSLNSVYITGQFGVGSTFYNYNNYLVRFGAADTVLAEVFINDNAWLVPASSYVFELEKLAES